MNYTALLVAVSNALGGAVTPAQIEALVPLAEAQFNRRIDSPERETESYATPLVDVQLPTDCWRLRDIWVMATSASAVATSLVQVSPEQAREFYAYETQGMEAFTLTGRTIDFWPTPAATNTTQVRIRYQAMIPPLSSSQLSNWLISLHPDIYYYGMLLQCETFIVDDKRLGIWATKLGAAMAELDELSAKQRYAQAPIAARPKRYDS